MFIDASAMVAILAREPEAALLTDVIGNTSSPITSALAVYETVTALCRKSNVDVPDAARTVDEFLAQAGIVIVPLTSAEAALALSAFASYGKGRGHPAKLNMGDCFAYAAARVAGCALLFKSNDFSHTDIASALRLA